MDERREAPILHLAMGIAGSLLGTWSGTVLHRLGIQGASFHTLRHTAASWMVVQGVDLYVVGQLTGRKTPRMTQRYAHLSPDYMAGAVNKLDGIMGGMLPATTEDSERRIA